MAQTVKAPTDEITIIRQSDGMTARATLGDLQQTLRGDRGIDTDSRQSSPTIYGEYPFRTTAAFAAIQHRVRAIRSIPLVVDQRGSDGVWEPVPLDNPWQQLYDRVNPFWSQPDLMGMTEMHLSIWGSAFWFRENVGTFKPVPDNIWPLRPDYMKVIPGRPTQDNPNPDYILGYMFDDGHTKISYLPDEITWFRRPNPLNEFAAMSPMAPVRLSLDMVHDAVMVNRNFFKNGARPADVFYVVQGPLDDDQVEEFYERLERRTKLPSNAHRPMIWDLDGGVEPKRLGMTNVEMEWIKGLNFGIEEASRAWDVPPELLGSQEKSTFNNKSSAFDHFYGATIDEEWGFIETEITELGLNQNEQGKLRVRFDRKLSKPLRRFYLTIEQHGIKEFQANLITRGEYRESTGRGPIEDVNDFVPDQELPGAASTEDPDETPAPSFTPTPFGSIQSQSFAERHDIADDRWRSLQNRLFRRQEADIIRKIRELDPHSARTILRDHGIQGGLFDQDDWRIVFQNEGQPLMQSLVATEGQIHMAETGLGSFDIQDRRIAEWSQDRTDWWATHVNQTTAEQLTSAIESSIEQRLTIPDTIKTIRKDVFGNISRNRAEMIARTETLSALNRGHLIAYSQSGVVFEKEWIAILDDRVRDAHEDADGQVVPVDVPFVVGGEQLMAPGNGFAGTFPSAENTINCILPGNRTLASGLLAGSSAFYVGPALEITTQRGHILTVTPNHPILTGAGFVPAKSLRPGHHVVSDSSSGRIVGGQQDVTHMPPMIEEIFGALNMVTRPIGTSPAASVFDFHGDGRFMDGDIEVIWANRQLQCACGALGHQPVHDEALCGANITQRSLAGLGSFDLSANRLLATAESIIGGSRQPTSFDSSGLGHSSKHSIAATTWSNASFNQNTPHSRPLATIPGSQGFLRHPGQVFSDDTFGKVDSPYPQTHAKLFEHPVDDSGIDVQGPSDNRSRFPIQVSLDNVTSVRQFDFAGHVYDLQTLEQLYISSGVVVHNCRCSTLPVLLPVKAFNPSKNGHSKGVALPV